MLAPLLSIGGTAAVVFGIIEFLSIQAARSKGIDREVPNRIWIQVIGGGLAVSLGSAPLGMLF